MKRDKHASCYGWGSERSFLQAMSVGYHVEELLFGRRYRATEKIGTGGMADVYKAVDETLGRTVAVKVMHAGLAGDPEFAARFRQEAQAAANLVSPNIVNMYDWGQDAGTYYIVMEYVRGSDLKSIIVQRGALPSKQVAEIGAQVCSALLVAHGYDVIHRDIKPHNIMVQPDGTVKVMDFGIARAGNTAMTQVGLVLGTAQYMSPEQAQGKPLTAASDLYALGVVLYEAATGCLPFDADTPVAVALMQVNEPAVPPRVANPGIDSDLDGVTFKAMQKKTSDRYVSADDLRRDLRAVAAGRPVDIEHTGAGYAVAGAGIAGAAGIAVAADVAAAARTRVGETAVMQGVDAPTALLRVDKTTAMPPARSSKSAVSSAGSTKNRAARKRKPVAQWAVFAVLVALLVVAGIGAANKQKSPVSPPAAAAVTTAAIPAVGSMTRAEAKVALEGAGFTLGAVTEAFDGTVAAESVVSQSPVSNTTAKRGSAVDLVLSKGPEMISVPDVVGMPEAQAAQALEAAGFRTQALPLEFDEDIPENTVMEQTPVGDHSAAKGSVVSYVVSMVLDSNDNQDKGDKPTGKRRK